MTRPIQPPQAWKLYGLGHNTGDSCIALQANHALQSGYPFAGLWNALFAASALPYVFVKEMYKV